MAKDFAKSKCFIKTDNGYKEITYEELLHREEADPSYKAWKFLPLHGMLMEVTPEEYQAFYKEQIGNSISTVVPSTGAIFPMICSQQMRKTVLIFW